MPGRNWVVATRAVRLYTRRPLTICPISRAGIASVFPVLTNSESLPEAVATPAVAVNVATSMVPGNTPLGIVILTTAVALAPGARTIDVGLTVTVQPLRDVTASVIVCGSRLL